MAVMRREALGARGSAMLATTVESDAGGTEVAKGWGRPRPWVIRPEVV